MAVCTEANLGTIGMFLSTLLLKHFNLKHQAETIPSIKNITVKRLKINNDTCKIHFNFPCSNYIIYEQIKCFNVS